ncbi:ATP-binding protein, partial [Streptomyces sp. NPDC001617]
MTAPLQPGERPSLRALAPVPLLTAVLAVLAVAGAVARVPDSERVPLALGGGAGALLLCAAVAVATHAYQTARIARRRLEAVTADTGRLLQDRIRQSAEFDQERVRLTEELTRERARSAAELAQERHRLTAGFTEERGRLTAESAAERARLTGELAAERARLTAENARLAEQARRADHDRATAVSATANAAGRMQALATGMLADLRAMEERHGDEDVLADLLHLDHRTAQAGRLADSVAVLTGARSGRRWARPIAMESIMRGAMGRISGYQRVRVHSACEAAVAGHAAEGVMHALAELLDNAANFSPPTAEVHVYVEEVPAGVIVSVEDSGLVMGDVQLRRAERAVAGDTEGLGGLTGTRLGLAVVGRLSRKYGLKVSYRPSARGGTGVLMLVPQDILVPEQGAARAPEGLPLPEMPVKPSGETPVKRSGEDAGSVLANGSQVSYDGKPPVSYDAHDTGTGTGEGTDTDSDGETETETDQGTTDTHHSPVADPDQDPLPGHHSRERDTGSLPEGLPKRRRGHALAEAERERERARARAVEADRERARARGVDFPDAEPPRPFPVSLDDPLARAARFSSFRRAVRGSLSDLGTPTPTEDTAVHDTRVRTPEPDTDAHSTRLHAPEPEPEAHATRLHAPEPEPEAHATRLHAPEPEPEAHATRLH